MTTEDSTANAPGLPPPAVARPPRSLRSRLPEETGVIVKAREPVHAFDAISRGADGEVEHHYVVVDLLADYVGGEPMAGDDAAEAAWVTVEQLGALAVSEETARLVRRLHDERRER